MPTISVRVPLDLLPDKVLNALQDLHLALKGTEYDAVQVTFIDLQTVMNVPTIDVQVSEE
jgi:hypothetical protein